MQVKIELNQQDIEDAVSAKLVGQKLVKRVLGVTLHAEQARDPMDRPTGGCIVTAEAVCELGE